MRVSATARYLRISPIKARPVLRLIVGQPAERAMATLEFLPNKAARLVAKVLKSAIANAENNYQIPADELRVVKAVADEGPRLKRWRAGPRGRVKPILKRTSHITVVLESKEA
ncbi:MAG: 50S ribosomal protein L22 [Chloroflexota bacterium]